MKRELLLSIVPAMAMLMADVCVADEPTTGQKAVTVIGGRRELFVDSALIESLKGSAQQRLHHPEPREIAIEHDAPWEGTGCGYHSVFHDGEKFRMYYKAWHLEVANGKVGTNSHPLYCCYAESEDGIHWKKPELGLVEFRGSKANNIVMEPGTMGDVTSDPGHPAVFMDDNPACPPDARYKAVIRASKPFGLLVYKSPDGLHWSPLHPQPVITEGAFDSQNLAFYDPNIGAYRAYWRFFTAGQTDAAGWKPSGIRAIRTAVSSDLVRWDGWKDLTYEDSPPEQLYTNAVKPYHRAPHLLIGFPARYVEKPRSDSLKALPEPEHREARSKAAERYGTAVTDSLLMSSRDGVRFHRWNEAFLRPGVEREGTWNYGHQYIAWHVVETKSELPDAPNDLSLYATESYWTGKSSLLRRYTLRMDGFVSVNASAKGGEVLTKPITFSGSQLSLNFSTSAAGEILVELQDVAGNPIPGYSIADCSPVFGDSIDRKVTWKGGADVSSLVGQTVRLRFVLLDADLFAYQFTTP